MPECPLLENPPLSAGATLFMALPGCLMLANIAQPVLADMAASAGLNPAARGVIVTMTRIGYLDALSRAAGRRPGQPPARRRHGAGRRAHRSILRLLTDHPLRTRISRTGGSVPVLPWRGKDRLSPSKCVHCPQGIVFCLTEVSVFCERKFQYLPIVHDRHDFVCFLHISASMLSLFEHDTGFIVRILHKMR